MPSFTCRLSSPHSCSAQYDGLKSRTGDICRSARRQCNIEAQSSKIIELMDLSTPSHSMHDIIDLLCSSNEFCQFYGLRELRRHITCSADQMNQPVEDNYAAPHPNLKIAKCLDLQRVDSVCLFRDSLNSNLGFFKFTLYSTQWWSLTFTQPLP